MRQKLMIIGLGSLGSWVLEFMARLQGSSMVDIVACDVNEDIGVRRVNSVLLGTQYFDLFPSIKFQELNLFDLDFTSEILEKEKPTIIFTNVSLQSWWVLNTLPQEAFLELDEAKFGPWLPMHLTLVYKLMQAIKSSAVKPFVINASFPDAVNTVLAKVGLPLTAGIGNIDNIVPVLRLAIAQKFDVPVTDVDLYMYLPHFVSSTIRRVGTTEGAPFIAKAFICGQDITKEVEFETLFKETRGSLRHPEGNGLHPVVASSAVRNIWALLKNSREKVHSPGPAGLPGGYPIRLSTSKGAEILLPKVSLTEAVEVNKKAQKFDGIEDIKDDGVVVFTDWAYEVMKKVLNYDCKELRPEESEDRSKELDAKFKSYAARFSSN